MTAARKPQIRIDDKGLRKFAREFQLQLQRGRAGPIRDMYAQWGVRYLSFVERQFVNQSEGGGYWPALSASTMKARRQGTKNRTASTTGKVDRRFKKRYTGDPQILRDTGTLLGALSIGKPGNLYKHENIGIRVGFDMGQKRSDSGVSVGQLAAWHSTGAGKLPARPILVEPDVQTRSGMMGDAERAVQTMMAKYAIPNPRRKGTR